MTVKHTMRDALIESRRIVADALNAFGPCDHSFGICNCDMKRSIEASDAALAEDDAARGAMQEEFEAWWAEEGYKFIMANVFTKDAAWGGAQWQASRAAAPQGEVVVTKNKSGQIVCVTRQDADGQILSVIAEAAAPQSVEPVAHMYPSDLARFATAEATATAFSVAVGCPDERSVPLYLAPPSAPTDAEWEAEHMRLAHRYADAKLMRYGRLGVKSPPDPDAACAALRAHLSTRPQQATDADGLDAERYRWLRKSEQQVAGPCAYAPWDGPPMFEAELDAAIDAAMSAQAGGKEQGS